MHHAFRSSKNAPPSGSSIDRVRAWSRAHLGFTESRFDAATERQFRAWYRSVVRQRVRSVMWLPLSVLLLVMCAPGPFDDLRRIWFGERYPFALDLLRFGVALPSSVAMLAITYTRLYRRYYTTAAQIIAPVHGICFVAMDVMMRPQGYNLNTWLLLVLLSSYFLYGLLVYQGIRSAALVLVSYVAVGLVAGLDSWQWRLDAAAIAFAAGFAGYIFYAMHCAVRGTYLDQVRMTDNMHRDALTGIRNRRTFDEHIVNLWQQATRERTQLGLLIVDIDYFKDYNDSLGHQAGDECLAQIARILDGGARRPLDLTARYGGEEFAILLYDADRARIEELCEQLQSQITKVALPHPASPVRSHVTVSIGAACVMPAPGRSQFGFIQLADEALYAAKASGRNRFVVMDREYDSLRTGAFRSHREIRDTAA